MVFHVDILEHNSVLKEIKDKADTIMLLIDNIGELDALISVASFRRTLTLWCSNPLSRGQKNRIRRCKLNRRSLPSADQKSGGKQYHCNGRHPGYRFQRFRQIHISENVAINSILAQTIHTCTATSCRAPFLKVMTSMWLEGRYQQR